MTMTEPTETTDLADLPERPRLSRRFRRSLRTSNWIVRADTAEKGVHALSWLVKNAGAEWVQFFATDLFRSLREKGKFGELARLISGHAELKDFARNMRDLIFLVPE